MADPPPPAGAGVSLSFAKPARPRVKVAEADEPSVRRELITGVQGERERRGGGGRGIDGKTTNLRPPLLTPLLPTLPFHRRRP